MATFVVGGIGGCIYRYDSKLHGILFFVIVLPLLFLAWRARWNFRKRMEKYKLKPNPEFFSHIWEKIMDERAKGKNKDNGFLIPETIDVAINKWHQFKYDYCIYFPRFFLKLFPVKIKEIINPILVESERKET